MTECEEVADSMAALGRTRPEPDATMDECRAHVQRLMPGESVTVIDNVAEALWRKVNR